MKAYFSNKTTDDAPNKVNGSLSASYQWFLQTPERAIEQAYKAALRIKSIEEEHFGGNKISADSVDYGENVMDYWQEQLAKNLNNAKLRLAEYKASRLVISTGNPVILEKLAFIDEVLAKYESDKSISKALVPFYNAVQLVEQKLAEDESEPDNNKVDGISDKTGVFPRSIGRTISRIKTELNPKSEEEVVKKFRSSSRKTKTAMRFVIILIIVPVLTQQVSKQFLVSPLVERFRGESEVPIFINSEMKEEALRELQSFEEELKFDSLIKGSPQIAPEVMEERVREKAKEIAEEFQHKSRDAIGNIFADLLGIGAFAAVIITNKKGIIALKSLIDDIVYGLSDSAKAFIIILFTDVFVGFHSPHGWEVVLEGLANHLGIAANKSAISLFIATVPVFLDTVFKYWIFRYLSRISPSAVATLRNMNE